MSRRLVALWCITLCTALGATLLAQERTAAVKDELRERFTQKDYENYLQALKRGEIPPQGGAVGSSVGPDVLVNNNNGSIGTARFTQSETDIVAFGNTVVIGFNDAGSYTGSNNQFTGWAYSTNGGTSFIDGGTLPTSTVGDAGDPVLARNNTTGRIYLSTLGFSTPGTIQMWRSDDNGVTWMPPVNATPGGSSEDKQWHVVDNFPGTGNGNVYMISRRFGTGPGIYVFRSTDHGSTFSPSGGTLMVSGQQGAYIAVGSDHSVYAFWWTSTSIQMRKSTDFGVTFGSPITVASGLVGGTNGDLGLTGIRQGLTTAASFRSNSFPHVDVNPVSGYIYVTYNTRGTGSDKGDIFFVQSTNGGTTWTTPVKVNDDATTTDQWQPTIAVTPNGAQLGFFYYSRQEDPTNNNRFKFYGRIARISGTTVTFPDPSFAVSDSASLPEFGRDAVVNSTYMGDYNHAVATATAFHVVWSDNRDDLSGGAPRKDPNVYYKRIPTTENFGWVRGTVTNVVGGTPVRDVNIDFVETITQASSITDSLGQYRAGVLVDTPGTTVNVTLRARKFAFRDTTLAVTITRFDTLVRNFAITPAASGTLFVRALRSDSVIIRSNVRVLFGTTEVVNAFTDSITGNFSTSLPTGTYDVIIDPPSPYGTRRFNGVVINASQTTSVYAVLRRVVEPNPTAMRDTLAVGQTRSKTLALTNTTADSVPWRLSTDETTLKPITREDEQQIARSQTIQPSYELPKGAIDTRSEPPIFDGRGGPDAFGYVWIDSDEPGGPAFSWFDIKSVGTQITTWTGSPDDGYATVSLPFTFPFYGNNYTSVNVMTNGNVQFAGTSTAFTNGAIPSTAVPNNAIYPFWDDLNFAEPGGTAWYYNDVANQRYIVQWDSVSHYLPATTPGRYTFQLILKADGQMLVQYRRMIGTLNSATIGIENSTGTVGLQVVFNAAYMHDSLAILFKLRGVSWLNYTPSAGVLPPSGNLNVTATFDATGLTAGTTYNGTTYLDLTHPDVTGSITLPSSLRVQAATGPLIILSRTTISYPPTPINATRRDSLTARNGGDATLNITSITRTNTDYTVTPSSANVAPGDSVKIYVNYTPTAAGSDTGRVIILSNSTGTTRVDVILSGTGILQAQIVAIPDSFYFSLPAGPDTTRATLKIKNPGSDTLRYNISEALDAMNRTINEKEKERAQTVLHEPLDLPKGAIDPRPGSNSIDGQGGPDAFGYRWIDSDEPGGPTYSWIDISATGTRLDSGSAWVPTGTFVGFDEGYFPVRLPFSFRFYGVLKDTVFIGTNGNVMFQRPTGNIFTNAAFPTPGGLIDEHIGVWWDDQEVSQSATIYYGTSGGNFVISFIDMRLYSAAHTGPPNYTYQIILSPGGLIKMQYQAMSISGGTLTSASIGIENFNASIGLQTVFNAAYMHNNLAIIYTDDILPWLTTDRTSGTIAPGDSQNVQLRVVPNQSPGTYVGRLRITGNTPDVKNVGVRLDITGGTASVTVNSPNGGENWTRGNTYPINWSHTAVDTVRIEYSVSGSSGPWRLITPGVPARPAGGGTHPKALARPIEGGTYYDNVGTYNWAIPDTVTPSTNCYVRVAQKSNPSVNDISNAAFTISAAAPAETTWTVQTSGTTQTLYSVKAVSANVAWAAGLAGTVVRTTNGGTNWLNAGPAGTDPIYAMTALDANTAFVASFGAFAKLWKTTNGGASWSVKDSVSGGFYNGVVMFDANNGYYQGDPLAGAWILKRTTNGGETWFNAPTLVPNPSTEAGWNNSFVWTSSTHGWFGTNSSHVYRTTDGGNSWSFAATTFVNSYSLWFNSSSTGVTGASTGATNRSTDGGASWVTSGSPAASAVFALSGASSGTEFWAVTGNNVPYSSNGGTAWSTASPNGYVGTIALNHVNMVTVGSNVYGWAVGNSGRIVRYRRVSVDVQSAGSELPEVYALDQNYPNPFNPTTTIQFALPEQASVSLKIYNVLGQEVRSLAEGPMEAGFFRAVWDGRNTAGEQISSGVYFYRFEATGASGSTFTSLKKMLFLK